MKDMKKRGISPLIATVILIGFVFVLGALAYMFLTEQVESFAEKSTKDCSPSEAAMAQISSNNCGALENSNYQVSVTNTGQGKIDGVRTRLISTTGEALSVTTQWGLDAGSSNLLEVKNLGEWEASKVESIQVIPFVFIEGTGEIIVCQQNLVEVSCNS